jgi:hypothetical protein
MVLVRRIRNRGANIVVEANGEVLFAPTGDVGRWTNRFSHRVLAAAQQAAPVNKRPRWGHYGKPLKTTFRASTTYQPGRMKVYSAIGSGSPHAYYVDQGTGVYAGNGPYEAKVLPPWRQGDPSLYESTWRPGGPGTRKVRPVVIKGQKGQFFFDAGLKRGFQSMRMRSFQVPGDGTISKALASIPTGLLNFLGNTPADAAFRMSLEEWRSWRDAAFDAGKVLGREGGRSTSEGQRRLAKAQAAKAKAAAAAAKKHHGLNAKGQAALDAAIKGTAKPKPKKPSRKPKNVQAHKADKQKFLAAMMKKYDKIDPGSLDYRDGYWYLTVWGPDPTAPGRNTWIEVRAKAKS